MAAVVVSKVYADDVVLPLRRDRVKIIATEQIPVSSLIPGANTVQYTVRILGSLLLLPSFLFDWSKCSVIADLFFQSEKPYC